MRITLGLKNQSIETSGITKDFKEAICEYIWNGFEANAKQVHLEWSHNALGGGDVISIIDNGDGINYDDLDNTFGTFLASQKNSLSLKAKSKANKGKGRFSFICFASDVIWKTTFYDDQAKINKSYELTLSDSSKEFVDYTEPVETDKHTGTITTLQNVFGISPEDLQSDEFKNYLLEEFAWYLYLNKDAELYINSVPLDYSTYINNTLSKEVNIDIYGHDFKINLIVWDAKIREKFCCYYLNEQNAIKGKDTTSFNRNTVEFYHSVFVKSNFFNRLNLEDINSDQTTMNAPDNGQEILKHLKKIVQDIISEAIDQHMVDKADDEINKMINERKTFPVFPNSTYGQYRKNDLKNVTKALYSAEPKIFLKLRPIQEKSLLAFLNLLLSTEEREEVLEIVDEIVNLSDEQRKRFVDILHKTSLENIVETISFIENRYRVIEILKMLIYDLTIFTNERDHIQKIVEQNYWLFGEKYSLVSADKPMQTALEKYTNILYGENNVDAILNADKENERRMDIFMCGSHKKQDSLDNTVEENIVVELKAPRVKLSKVVYRQIEDYMLYIRRQPNFNSQYRSWKFIAVCREVDDDIKDRYETFKDKGKPGLVYLSGNCEIYAYTWDDVFRLFDINHSFCLDKLKYDRDALIKETQEKITDKDRKAANALTNKIINNSEGN